MSIAFADGCGQHRMRAQFDDGIAAEVDKMLDPVGELHGLPDVVPPVIRTQLRPLDPSSGDGGEQRQRRGAGQDAAQRRQQFVAYRVHLGAVEGVLHLQKAAKHLPLFQNAGDFLQRRRIAGQRDRSRAVDSGEADVFAVGSDQPPRFVRRDARSEHSAACGSQFHAAATLIDDAHGVFKAEHAGQIRGGHLADAVAYHRLGLHAPGTPQCRQRRLERENRRLRDGGHGHARAILVGGQLLSQRPGTETAHDLVAALDRLAEDRLLLQ